MAGRILRIAGMMSITISFISSVILAGGFTEKWGVETSDDDDEMYIGSFQLDDDPQLEVVTADPGTYECLYVIDGSTGSKDTLCFYRIEDWSFSNGGYHPKVYVADIDNDGKGEIIVYAKLNSGDHFHWYAFDYSGFKVEEKDINPTKPTLLQNYPNPLSSATRIKYNLPKKGKVALKIYNEVGQLVRTLVDGEKKPGKYITLWDGRDNKGKKVASGSYFYKIETENHNSSKKMILVK